jgi:inner membrane protein YidH
MNGLRSTTARTGQVVRPSPDPRVQLAAERTLLAWIRTGLAMMAFGFVVSRFALFLRELAALGHARTRPPSGVSLGLGTSLILLGAAVNVIAAGQHARFLRRTSESETHAYMAIVVALVLALAGVGMAAYLLTLDAGVGLR